jgi:prepilin-type N-terminal cleavage/methylation domain-containing protein
MISKQLSGNGAGVGQGGFSLAEILLAMAIAALLMTMLLSILSKSMDVSKRTNAGMISKSSAQAALDLITTDLESMTLNRSIPQVFFATNQRTSNAAATITNSVFYLLSSSPIDSYGTNASAQGIPRLIQYTVVYSTNYASTTTKSFALYRNVLDQANTIYLLGSSQSFDSGWNSILSASDSSGASTNGISTNLLVPNVVSFNVSLLTNFGSGIWTNADSSPVQEYGQTNYQSGIMAEVSVTVLDEPIVTRFGSGDGKGNNSPGQLMMSQGRTLIRRVSLPCPP